MNKEKLFEQLRMLIPGEYEKLEKEKGKILADRFDTIKPQLKELGVRVVNSAYRDSDDRFVSTYRLSFNEKEIGMVKSLLSGAGIQEIVDPGSEKRKWQTIGTMAGFGMMNDEFLLREAHTKEIIFYRGKYLNDEDCYRLITLEPKATPINKQ
jgi:hypothetical protein